MVPPGHADGEHVRTSDNFLPLYINNDQNSQVFFSQATFNQLLYLIKGRENSSYINDTFLGVPCTLDEMKGYILNLDTHPVSQTCKFKVYLQEDYSLDEKQAKAEISFQAGDIYAENVTMTIDLLFQDIDYLF